MIDKEITTDEVESILENGSRISIRLPLMGTNDVAVERSVGFLQTLEQEVPQEDMEVIIFSKNALTHSLILNGNEKKSIIAEKLAYRLHLDYLAYSEFIISLPKNDKNIELSKRLCLRYGIDSVI